MRKTADVPNVNLHRLPVQLRMLVRVMGEAAAYQLVKARGGTPLTVPKSLRSDTGRTLIDLAGTDGAAALVAYMPGETLQLPKYDSVMRQLRHQRVVELRRAGATQAAIATATGYTVRQVINILGGIAADEEGFIDEDCGQGDLFGHDPAEAAEAGGDAAEPQPSAHDPFSLAGAGRGKAPATV